MAEVMYDNSKNISGENPEHIEWVRNVAKPLFESWGYKVTILRSSRDYNMIFYHTIERSKDNPDHIGKYYGFPISKLCSVKRDCKTNLVENYVADMGDNFQYVGIAIDEPQRLISMHKKANRISLLEQYNLTEKDAYNLCLEYGLLSPSYKYTKRNGCFFCPNAKISECECIKRHNPDVWKDFISHEDDISHLAFDKWNPLTKVTLHEIDKKIDTL